MSEQDPMTFDTLAAVHREKNRILNALRYAVGPKIAHDVHERMTTLIENAYRLGSEGGPLAEQ